jgi:ureidoacrylate peracid hydrolase
MKTKALLLVIDFINDIVHPKGKVPSCAEYVEKYQVMENVNQAIHWARKQHFPVVHVKVGFNQNYEECPEHSPLFSGAKQHGALKLGEWGTEFHEKIDVNKADLVIIKHRVSALYATPLAAILGAQQINTVIVTGVSTNMAVETITRELHDRDFNLIVLEDACGAATREIHEASLKTLARIAKISKALEWTVSH